MTEVTELRQNIERLSDEEISDRIRKSYYSDEAIIIATEVLRERGVPVPEANSDVWEVKPPFYKAHPIWFITLTSLCLTVVARLIKQLSQ
jgi:hypothetical protein